MHNVGAYSELIHRCIPCTIKYFADADYLLPPFTASVDRDMRVWDDDGAPVPEAMAYGEFVIKVS